MLLPLLLNAILNVSSNTRYLHLARKRQRLRFVQNSLKIRSDVYRSYRMRVYYKPTESKNAVNNSASEAYFVSLANFSHQQYFIIRKILRIGIRCLQFYCDVLSIGDEYNSRWISLYKILQSGGMIREACVSWNYLISLKRTDEHTLNADRR